MLAWPEIDKKSLRYFRIHATVAVRPMLKMFVNTFIPFRQAPGSLAEPLANQKPC